MKNRLLMLLLDEQGVTATEYALVASLIAVVILAAVMALGDSVKADYDKVATCLSAPSAKICHS